MTFRGPRRCAAVCLFILGIGAAVFPRTFIVITELLRNPVGNEDRIPGGRSHEFVEIANLGDDTLTVDSLFLSDGLDNDSVIPWTDYRRRHPNCISGVRSVPPGRIAVILDPEYDSGCALEPDRAYPFADSTILLTVGDSHLGDYSNLAETDGVFLYKGTVTQVDRIIACTADTNFEVPPEKGHKLLFASLGTLPDGVSVRSRSVLFGWPLYEPAFAGLSPGRVEIIQSGWLIDYCWGAVSDSAVVCSLAVLRVGGSTDQAQVTVGRRGEGPSPVPRELGNGVYGDKRYVVVLPLDGGTFETRVEHGGLVVSRQLDLSAVWVPAAALRISEVFPKAGNGIPEWFEIVNISTVAISLDGWAFGDNEDTVEIYRGGITVLPGKYLVLTADPNAFAMQFPTVAPLLKPPRWHTLSNDRDSLCLWDRFGRLHECVSWDSRWFSGWASGSLERLWLTQPANSVGNWAVADPPSPARPNKSVVWRAVAEPQMTTGPVPFTPNGDGRDDYLAVRVKVPPGTAVTIAVYGMDGERVRTLWYDGKGECLWDGRTDRGGPAPVGPFFVVATVKMPEGRLVTLRRKGVLWR